jgi:hypothetical protein
MKVNKKHPTEIILRVNDSDREMLEIISIDKESNRERVWGIIRCEFLENLTVKHADSSLKTLENVEEFSDPELHFSLNFEYHVP